MDYSKNLLIKVAEYYYNENLNQQEIAKRLKISRVKVSRLLTEARNKGLVKIEIVYPKDNCIELERQLEEKYHLEEVVIISSTSNSADSIHMEVTNTAAQFIEEKVNPKDIIGIAWGRTLKKVSERIGQVNKEVEIVQLLGNIGSSEYSGDVIVRNIAKSFQASIYLLPAPAIVDSSTIKDAIKSDGHISSILEMQKKCSLAIVGIGQVSENSTLVMSNYLKEEDLKELKKHGAVGEVVGRFVDEKGQVCKTSVNDRVLGIEIENLKEIPCVVAIASDEEKGKSIKAVLKTGSIDVLITDENTAKNILKLE